MFKTHLLAAAFATTSVWAAAGATPFVPSNPRPSASYSQHVLLKNWALSDCLAQITHDEVAIRDARAAAGGYLQFGQQGLEAYQALHALVNQFLSLEYVAKPEPGVIAPSLNTMKCIDLFHSKELDQLTRRLAGTKPR